MISRLDVEERAREWGLREDVVEKDYVLGWLLWGIGTDPSLATTWVFKGGTCLKKCFLETYRFSEDLDFTVLPSGPSSVEEIRPLLERVLVRVRDESGIEFSRQPPLLRARPSDRQAEGRIHYVGPRATPGPASVKLDINAGEVVVRPTCLRPISHSYPDALPPPATVCSYSFEEVFAEKLRAMGERGRPRDLYDVVNLFRRPDLHPETASLRAVLGEKCRTKGVPVPTAESVITAAAYSDLATSWENMLGHQLLALPPLEDFWSELRQLFDWLEGERPVMPIASMSAPMREPMDEGWQPPASVSTWGQRVPLESIRFAAANHLCVALGYEGTTRVIEPYSLRRTQAGHYLLFAVKADSGENRSYRVDRIEHILVTARTFHPRFRVEFTSTGPIHAPALERGQLVGSRSRIARSSTGIGFMIQCPYCFKSFRRTSPSIVLGIHKDPMGNRCSGSGHMGVRA